MASSSNQGFAAVVGSIERLRDTLIGDASRKAAYGRTRLSEQRRQTDELRGIRKAIDETNRKERATKAFTGPKQPPKERSRDERGRYISARQAKAIAPTRAMVPDDFSNQLLAEWKVALGEIKQVTVQEMRALVTDIRGQALRPIRPMERQRREKDLSSEKISIRSSFLTVTADRVAVSAKSKESQQKDNASLAKSLAGEIKNLKIQVDGGRNNPLGLVFQGLVAGIGFKIGSDISKGLQKGFKERTGFDAKTAGAGVGRFVGNPKESARESVRARRRSQVRNYSVQEAQRLAQFEDVDIADDKENIFTVGGMGAKGKGGVDIAKKLKDMLGKDKVKTIPFKTQSTDPLVDAKEEALQFSFQLYWNYLRNMFVEGANPDAIKLAAKVIAAKQKNKNANIQLVAHSQGGDVVEEAIAILMEAGIDDVVGTGLGSPNMGVGFKTKGRYRSIFGKTDELQKGGLTNLFGRRGQKQDVEDVAGVSNLTGHGINAYLNHPETLQRIAPEQRGQVLGKALRQQINGITRQSNVASRMGASGALSPGALNSIGADVIQQIKDGQKLIQDSQEESLVPLMDHYRQLSEQLGEVFPGLGAEFAELNTIAANFLQAREQIKQETTQAKTSAPPRQSLAQPIRDRLTSVVQQSRQSAQERMATLIPNFQGMAPNQRRERAGQYYEGWKGKVQEYRKLIDAKRADLAAELAEQILSEGEALYKSFGDMAAKDKSLAGSFGGFRSYISNVRGEIAGKETQAGFQPGSMESLVQGMESSGDNAVSSMLDAIAARIGELHQAGQDIGNTLAGGTEDALGIQSPSKVFKAIGKDIIAGLMQGMDGFDGTLEEKEKILETYVKSVIELIYNFKKVTGKPMGEADKVRKLFQEIGGAGEATPKQLQEAKKYFPGVERLPDDSPGVALYNPKQNKIKIKQGRSPDKLFEDLVHEYTHAIQARFGTGMRFASTPADYFPKTGISPKGEQHLNDPRVEQASDASAQHLMGAFDLTPEQGKRYEVQYNHVKRREAEAYSNELGAKAGKERRGFFLADAEEIAAEIKAKRKAIRDGAQQLTTEIKTQAEQVKEVGQEFGEQVAEGLGGGKEKIQGFFDGLLDWLENIPIIGQLVKFGRMIAGAVGGLFTMMSKRGQKQQTTTAKPKPQQIPIQWDDDEVSQPQPVPITTQTSTQTAKPKVKFKNNPQPVQADIDPKQITEQIQELAQVAEDSAKEIGQQLEQVVEQMDTQSSTTAPEIEEAVTNAINPKEQADRYLAYLFQWAKGIGDALDESLVKEIAELKASGQNVAQAIRSKIDTVGEGLDQKKAQFRQAIADGNAELSKALGKELVEQTAQMRVLFKRMAENVKFMEGRGMWKDQAWQMTMLQQEAIKGYPKLKGRAKTGVWQAVGESTSEGFTAGIESELKEAEQSGIDIGEAAIKGAKKALGIKSPSQEFFEIANMVVEGWNGGLEALGDGAANNVRRFLRDVDEGANDAVDTFRGAMGDLLGELNRAFPIFGQIGKLALAIFGGMILENILGVAVQAFAQLATASFEAVVGFESLNRSFVALTGSSAKAKTELQFVSDTAKKLGIDLQTAEQAYQGLLATTRGTALQGAETKKIFDIFAQTASVRGLSTEEQGRMFAAIQQMLGKQKISAEEVRGQLGEIAGLDFQGTLARSMGIGVAQLDDAMSSGSIMAADVLPKVAAQYAAENATVSNSAETTAQALARYDNAILQLQRSMSSWFDEVKIAVGAATWAVEQFTKIMPGLIQFVSALGLVLAWNSVSWAKALIVVVKNSQIAMAIITTLKSVIMAFIKAILPQLGVFIAKTLLLQLAFDALGAAFNVTQNRFKEYANSIDAATKAAIAHEQAVAKLNKTTSQSNPLPTDGRGVVTDQTWKPFGFDTGLNLEGTRKALGLTTLGEKQMNDFIVQSGGQMLAADQTVMAGSEEKKRIEQVLAIEEQLNVVRSRRFENIAGDRQAYEKSVEEEKKLLAQREELVAATSAYSERLTKDITATEQALSDLDALVARGGITQAAEQTQRAALEDRLGALKEAQQGFDEMVNSVQLSTSALSRELQNIEEKMSAFSETLERISSRRRIDYLTTALQNGTGSAVRGVGLANLSQQEAVEREAFLRQMLGRQETNLQDDEWSAKYAELERQLLERGLEMNLASLERIIGERDPQTTEVAKLAKRIIETRQELQQTQEAIAQNAIDLEESVFGLTRQVNDFFQNLTQQIVDAQFEIAKATNQLKSGQLKLKLQQAIVPGSNSFLNGVVQSIQGLFDEAAGVLDSILGSQQRRFQLTGANYSLENQMQDFQRSVAGATEAVNAFRASLGGGAATTSTATSTAASGGTRQQQAAATGGTFSGTFGQNTVMNLASQFGLKKNSRAGNHFGSKRTRGNPGSYHRSGSAVDFGDLEQGVSQREAHKKFSDFVKKVIADGTATHIEEIIWNGHGSPLGDWFATGGKGPFYKLSNGKKVGISKSLAQSHADHLHLAETTTGGDPYVTVASNAKAQPASTPTTQSNAPVQTTKASFYGGPTDRQWHGRKTASGEVYDENGLTVAVPYRSRSDKRPSIPFGTYILVTNPANGKQVVVRVTDTGSFGTDPKYGGRGLDLSYGAAKQLGTVQAGVANVNYQVLGKNPPSTTAQANQAATTTPANDPVVNRARSMTSQMQGLNLDLSNLSDADAALKLEQFLLNNQQRFEEISRQFSGFTRDTVNATQDARNDFADLVARYGGQTLTNQAEADVRELESTFRNKRAGLEQQARDINDFLLGIERIQQQMGEISAQFGSLSPEQQQILQPILEQYNASRGAIAESVAAARSALVEVQGQLAGLDQVRQQAERFIQIQAEQRSIQQELQSVGLEGEIAQASGNNEAKLQSDLRRIELNRASMANEATLSMADRPEELKTYLANLQKQADLAAQRAVYERESADAAIALEVITKAITRAEFEGNESRKMQLEMAKAAIELKQEEARINLEVFETDKKRTLLGENRLGYLNRIEQIERDFQQSQIQRADLAFEREQRFQSNAASLERNPYTAATMQEAQEMQRLREEFSRKEIEILNNPAYGTAAEKQAAIAREADILAQNLQLVDRQFLDLTESIGMGVAGAFNSFFDALLRGENALQAFGNALMESLMEIGKNLINSGVNNLIGGLFGFSEGGYTGEGGKYQPAGIVHAGEFVINKEATKKLGLPLLGALNQGMAPGYALGGLVAPMNLESNLLSGLNSRPNYNLNPSALATAGSENRTTGDRRPNITIEQNFHAPVDRFNPSANTLAREQAEAMRRAIR